MTRRIGVLCPSCGAPAGGRDGCQAQFDGLSARAWEGGVRAAMHNMVVDAYALQHPDEYCVSAKSYAAHLTGLCCGVEHPGDQKLYWQIPRWLDGPAAIEKPPVLETRGRKTISRGRLPDERIICGSSMGCRWATRVAAVSPNLSRYAAPINKRSENQKNFF